MSKKNVYSLYEYMAGISPEDFEKSRYANEGSAESSAFNLTEEMKKLWRAKYAERYEKKPYLYYKHLDDLVDLAREGQKDATEEILAFALHAYQPHNVMQKHRMWQSVGEDDICQIVCMATLEAIKRYAYDKWGFNNFAGYLKSWVRSQILSAQVDSSPVVQRSKEKRKNSPITYIMLDEQDDDSLGSPIVLRDFSDQFEQVETDDEDQEFIKTMKNVPNRVGEVLLIYYGIEDKSGKQSLEITAQKTGLTVKQVRNRLEKGRKLMYSLYPELAATLVKVA